MIYQHSKSKQARMMHLKFPEASNSISDTPHVGQGRNRHNSAVVNRDALIGALCVLLGWPLTAFVIGLVLGIARALST